MEHEEQQTGQQRAIKAYYSGNIFTKIEVFSEKKPKRDSSFKSLGVKTERDFAIAVDEDTYYVYKSNTYEWDDDFIDPASKIDKNPLEGGDPFAIESKLEAQKTLINFLRNGKDEKSEEEEEKEKEEDY